MNFNDFKFLESESNGGNPLLLTADDQYINTITDFIKLFVSAHLKRCEDTDKVIFASQEKKMFEVANTLQFIFLCTIKKIFFLDRLTNIFNGMLYFSFHYLSFCPRCLRTPCYSQTLKDSVPA